MFIVDSHLDLAWNALQWNRDLRQSVDNIRAQEKGLTGKGMALGTVAFPELQKGRVAFCFATLLSRSTGNPVSDLDFSSYAQCYGIAQGQLAYYRALEREGEARIITNLADLNYHIAEWENWDTGFEAIAKDTPPLGIVISMESADPISKPEHLSEWKEARVRIIGPAHYGPGRYAGGTSSELGLTELGNALLPEMEQQGILLDMTHLSDKAFWQSLELYNGTILASHNNCRTLVPHQRQFSDEQLKAIIERGGVIGAAFDTWMLQPDWKIGKSTNENVTLSNVVDHIDHVCQLAGNSHHAAIGTDLDGGFGREQSPSDLDTIADLQKLVGLLADRGYKDQDITAIMHGNWIRLLRKSWSDEN